MISLPINWAKYVKRLDALTGEGKAVIAVIVGSLPVGVLTQLYIFLMMVGETHAKAERTWGIFWKLQLRLWMRFSGLKLNKTKEHLNCLIGQ